MYVKLFSSILDSSIWAEPNATRLVWITLLAMADEEGFVRAVPSGIARRAAVTLPECITALDRFLAPDSEGSQEHAGRRVESTEGGWRLLNYKKYREIQTKRQRQIARAQQTFRDKQA